ncbi:uncharacterized protein LOC113797992 [Dermatophagoides pteronyssinus]|uniref:uncharacterized protein LOC113797992 n=1 Tax=Dermatophagoides pteronyssinus TaxID=6956 RepID=UPI003F663785
MNFLLIMCILQFSSTKILAEKILFNGKSYKSTEILQIRFPYKPVYGLPEHFNCTMITKEEFEQCEIEALKAWTITIRNYFYQSKYFCCFVWCALDCEIELMNKCNETHSKYMKDSTTEWFKKACHFFDKTSAFCKIKPDFETFFYDNYVIFIILLIIVGLCTLNREYHGITRSDVLRSIEKFYPR